MLVCPTKSPAREGVRPTSGIAAPTGIKIEGHGPAIVLLHSSMASKSQWKTLMEHMRATHRLIAIDLHGYGDNGMPECRDGFSLGDEVELVQTKLSRVLAADEPYHLVGHSFGGGVALRLAHADPQRIRSLCLYEPTAFHLLERRHPALEEISHVARAAEGGVRRGEHGDATALFIDYWSSKGAFAAMPPSRQALFASLLPKVPLDFQALMNDPHRASDYRHTAPASCVITGRNSPHCVHAIASVLAATLPHCETTEIAAGHMGPLTHPGLVNPIIEEFIQRIDRQDKRLLRRVSQA